MRSKRNKPKGYMYGELGTILLAKLGGKAALKAGAKAAGKLGLKYAPELLMLGNAAAQRRQGQKQMELAMEEYEKLKASAPSLSTPEQYYENYKNAYDAELARIETDNINRAYSANLEALTMGGSRATVGGLPAVEQSRFAAQNTMLGQERAMRQAAGSQLAQAQDAEIARRMDENRFDRQLIQASFDAGAQNVMNARQGGSQNLLYAGLGRQKKGDNLFEDLKGVKEAYDALADFNAKTGGMVTDGEFNHETNPIQLVQDGEVVGEVTGGEVVLNPEQAKKIAEQSSFARKLFERFVKEARERNK